MPPRRFKATVTGKLYSSKSNQPVKEYLEAQALEAWAKSKGAVQAEVTGPGHSGGTNRTEPFHLNVVLKDAKGRIIQTINPTTNQPTNIWHLPIAGSKEELRAKAEAWKAAKDAKK